MFTTLMKSLGVPAERQAATRINANWFLRQGIAFYKHPRYIEAREAALKVANDNSIPDV